MAGENFYLLSFLPSLVGLGDPPPLSCADLLDRLHSLISPRPGQLGEAVFLSDDLLQREAFLTGELEGPTPTVLTVPQVRDEMPLPDFLQSTSSGETITETTKIASDVIWRDYFFHVARVARTWNSRFLTRWVSFEVTFRNAIAEARAQALQLEPEDYFVAEALGGSREDYIPVVNEWSAAGDPRTGQRVLDLARWRWLHENDAYFSFGDDELGAYSAKLMLAERWYRLNEAMEKQGKT